MKVDTMRKVDYWLGVPITWVLTLFFKLAELFTRKKSVKPQRILFIELSEMGSTIIADPAMRKAKNYFNAELFFLIFARNKVSLSLLNTVPAANIFTIRENNLLVFLLDVLRFIVWARRQRIDTVFDLELFSRATALLTALSGAKNRVGYFAFYNEGLSRGRLLTHHVSYNPHIHMAKNFIALIDALINPPTDLPHTKSLIKDEEIKLTQAVVSETEKEQVKIKVKQIYKEYDPTKHRLVLINPNASELLPQRCWPVEHFATLIQMILAEHADTLVLITGAPNEYTQAEHLCQRVDSQRCVNFAGAVKFLELVPLYTIAKIMVTNDSGPGHFSAVTSLPTIVLFGPETPKLYGSLGNTIPVFLGLACSPCVSAANHRKTPCQDNVCLKWIMPQQVMNEVNKIL